MCLLNFNHQFYYYNEFNLDKEYSQTNADGLSNYLTLTTLKIDNSGLNINFNNYSQANVENLKYVIKTYNSELKRASKYNNFGYLDLYKLTNRGDGISNNHWHIDNFHLSPTAMLEAWKFYYPNI